jgi:DNA-binding MarR family transcriptional regulator
MRHERRAEKDVHEQKTSVHRDLLDLGAYAHSANAPKPCTIPSIDEDTLGAWQALLNAHARITTAVEAALAEAKLPPLAWYDVLWPLQRAPDHRLRMGTLADEVTLSRTGLTRLVDRIEREGLLHREPAPEDRRGFYVVISPAGTAVLGKMWPVYEHVLDTTFAASVRNARALRRQLDELGR